MHEFTSGLSNLFHWSISLFLWLSIYSFMSSVNTDSFTSFLIWMPFILFHFRGYCSITQSCPTLYDPMNRSTPGLPVHHQIPEFTDSRPSSQWCHPVISSSVIPFSSCPQSLPASQSFPMSQLFARGGQSIGVSALASFLPKNTQYRSPLEWTGWIFLQVYLTAKPSWLA